MKVQFTLRANHVNDLASIQQNKMPSTRVKGMHSHSSIEVKTNLMWQFLGDEYGFDFTSVLKYNIGDQNFMAEPKAKASTNIPLKIKPEVKEQINDNISIGPKHDQGGIVKGSEVKEVQPEDRLEKVIGKSSDDALLELLGEDEYKIIMKMRMEQYDSLQKIVDELNSCFGEIIKNNVAFMKLKELAANEK